MSETVLLAIVAAVSAVVGAIISGWLTNVATSRRNQFEAKVEICKYCERWLSNLREEIAMFVSEAMLLSLVEKKEHLPKLIKQLQKLKATHRIIPMEQGHKKSRILAWTFRSSTSS